MVSLLHMVVQLLLYNPPPPFNFTALPSFLLPFCSSEDKSDILHIGQGLRGICRSATNKCFYQVDSTDKALSEKNKKKRIFPLQRGWKKTEQRKDSKGNGKRKNSFLETWSDFGAACSVDMTSCIFFDYLIFAGSWETEAWAKKRKIEWKLSPCLVWKQLERADVIVWYNSLLNEM